MPNIPAEYRRWLYLLTMAAIPILVAYDVISDDVAPLWANLVAAFLGVSTAAFAVKNITPDKESDDG